MTQQEFQYISVQAEILRRRVRHHTDVARIRAISAQAEQDPDTRKLMVSSRDINLSAASQYHSVLIQAENAILACLAPDKQSSDSGSNLPDLASLEIKGDPQ